MQRRAELGSHRVELLRTVQREYVHLVGDAFAEQDVGHRLSSWVMFAPNPIMTAWVPGS
jgi:hypothetical protein